MNGYAKTENKNVSLNISAVASDWESRVTGKPSVMQIVNCMTIHRMSGSKEIVYLLHKEAHCISYNDVRKFNDYLATSI